jgi:hypothetical protein
MDKCSYSRTKDDLAHHLWQWQGSKLSHAPRDGTRTSRRDGEQPMSQPMSHRLRVVSRQFEVSVGRTGKIRGFHPRSSEISLSCKYKMLATMLPFRNKTYSNYLHGHQNFIHEQPPTLFQHILGRPLPFSRSHSRSEIRTTYPRTPPENGRHSDWGVIV